MYYHEIPKVPNTSPDIRRTGFADPKDRRYWPMIGGKAYDSNDMALREKLMADSLRRNDIIVTESYRKPFPEIEEIST